MAERKIEFPSLLYYQKPVVKALENKSAKYVTFLASRRIGKSLIAKCMAVKWCLSENRINVGFIVPTGTLAVLFIKEIVQNLTATTLTILQSRLAKSCTTWGIE